MNYNYTRYNHELHNDSAAILSAPIELKAYQFSPFATASLRAWNATEDKTLKPGVHGGSPNNYLVVVILYGITSPVSA